MTTFNDPGINTFENFMEQEENAGDKHYVLFPECLLPYQRKIAPLKPQ